MSAEEMKKAIHRIIDEAWNKGNLGVVEEVASPNIVYRCPPLPEIAGLKAYQQNMAGFRQAFPDIAFTVEEIIIEGNTSAVRYTVTGTHKGQAPNFPIPPTGKWGKTSGCSVGHWQGGKLAEELVSHDWLGMLQQIGVVPKMG